MKEQGKILVKKLSAYDKHNENLYRVVSVIGRSVHQPELLRPPFFVLFFYYFYSILRKIQIIYIAGNGPGPMNFLHPPKSGSP